MAVKTFEGEDVDGSVVKLKQHTGNIEKPLMRGEKIKLTIEAEVRSVSFEENLRTGRVYRVHTLHTTDVKMEAAGQVVEIKKEESHAGSDRSDN